MQNASLPGVELSGAPVRAFLLALLSAIGLGAFVTIRPEQPWILWLTTAAVLLASDGIVRSHPLWRGTATLSTLPFVFLPAAITLGGGLFIDHALNGYARPLSAIAVAALAGFAAFGEHATVDIGSRAYATMRLVLALGTYLAAFALYTVIFSRDVALPLAAFAVGVVSMGLALELLRESRLLGPSSVLVSLAVGLSMAELRLALYFFPLDGVLAGALLIIGFYLATGLAHHLLDHDLEFATMAEYLLVGGAGTAAVIITRLYV